MELMEANCAKRAASSPETGDATGVADRGCSSYESTGECHHNNGDDGDFGDRVNQEEEENTLQRLDYNLALVCPIRDFILRCRAEDRELRPSFDEIEEHLNDIPYW